MIICPPAAKLQETVEAIVRMMLPKTSAPTAVGTATQTKENAKDKAALAQAGASVRGIAEHKFHTWLFTGILTSVAKL